MPKRDLLSLWYEALNAPHGLGVRTDDRQLLRQQLYACRSGYDELTNYAIIFPQDEEELFIIKKRGSDG
jgi:hypothetical protein